MFFARGLARVASWRGTTVGLAPRMRTGAAGVCNSVRSANEEVFTFRLAAPNS